jgi:hypothetical protein
MWQCSRAWNWGNEKYIFKVPDVELADWLELRFMSPDEWLIYIALEEYYHNNPPLPELLSGLLGPKPVGRIFPPYKLE